MEDGFQLESDGVGFEYNEENRPRWYEHRGRLQVGNTVSVPEGSRIGCHRFHAVGEDTAVTAYRCFAPGPHRGYHIGTERLLPYIPAWCPERKKSSRIGCHRFHAVGEDTALDYCLGEFPILLAEKY